MVISISFNMNDGVLDEFATLMTTSWEAAQEKIEDFLTTIYGEDYEELLDVMRNKDGFIFVSNTKMFVHTL